MTLALLQTPAAGGPNPMIANLLLIGGMIALFYFFIIRPQSKARKQMEERLSKLKAGDEVLLSSGLFATIDRLDEKDVKIIYVKFGNQVVKARRSAVVALAGEPAPDPQN